MSTTSILGLLGKSSKIFPRKGDVVIGQRQYKNRTKNHSAARFTGVSMLLNTQIAVYGDTFDASSDAITRDTIVRQVVAILQDQGVRFLSYDTIKSDFVYIENMDEARREIFFAFIDRSKTHGCIRMIAEPSTTRSDGGKEARNSTTGSPTNAKRRRLSEGSSSSKKAITDDDSVATNTNVVDLTDEAEEDAIVDTTLAAYNEIVSRAAQQEQPVAATGSHSTAWELSTQHAQMSMLQQQQRIAAINSLTRQQQEMNRRQHEASRQQETLHRLEASSAQQQPAQVTATPNAFSVAAGNMLQQRQEHERRSISSAAFQQAASLLVATAPNTANKALPSSHVATYADYFYKPLRMKELPIKTTQDMVGWHFLAMNMEKNLKDLPLLNEWRIVVTPTSGNLDRSFTIDPSNVLPTVRE